MVETSKWKYGFLCFCCYVLSGPILPSNHVLTVTADHPSTISYLQSLHYVQSSSVSTLWMPSNAQTRLSRIGSSQSRSILFHLFQFPDDLGMLFQQAGKLELTTFCFYLQSNTILGFIQYLLIRTPCGPTTDGPGL